MLAGLLAILLALGGIAYGLATRPDGVDRLARLLQPYVPVAYDYDRAEGSLAGPVHITGLRVSGAGWTLSVGQLDLLWQPARLLRRLTASAGVTVRRIAQSTSTSYCSTRLIHSTPGINQPPLGPATTACITW